MKTMQLRTMYGLRFLLALVVSLVLGIGSAWADTASYQILIDTDHNPASGCTLNTAQGSFAGAELRLLTTVSFGNGPTTVSGVQLQHCVGGAFGPSLWSSPGGWPVGQGTNADIIETLLPLTALGGATSLRLGVVAEANGSLDTLFLTNGQPNGQTIGLALPGGGGGAGPFDPPQPIPVLHPLTALGLALLLAGLAAYGLRRRRGLLAFVLLAVTIGTAGLAWAAMQLDGQSGDWNGKSPLASDPRGDAVGMADLLALFAKVEGPWLHLRLDVSGEASTPTNQTPQVNAGDDQNITLPTDSVSLVGVVNDDGLPNPPASVTITWSKSSGPGTVSFGNANAANTSAQFSADGSYVLHLAAFDGQLTGGDDVQIVVNPAPAPAVNQAVLGPLAGAQIQAYRLNNLDTPVEGPITANSNLTDLNLAGTFSLSLAGVPDDEWVLVTASGGQDIDANDDGQLDPVPTANQGTLHALAKASDWRAGGVRINILTEIAWQELEQRVASGQIDDLDARLRWIANSLLKQDITGDTDQDYRDLIAFDPGSEAFRKSLDFPYGTFLAKNDAGRSLFDEIHEGLKNAERDWIAAFFGGSLQIPRASEIIGVSIEVQLPPNREGLRSQDLLISSVVSSGAQILDQGATLMIAKDAAGHTVLLAFALPGQVAQFSPRSTALALVMLALGGPRDVQGFTELAGKVTAQAGFNPLVIAIENTLKADPFFLDRLMTYVDLVNQVKSVATEVKAAASAAPAAFQARALASRSLAAEASLPIAKQDFYCFWLIACSPWDESEPWDWYGDAKGAEALWPDNLYEAVLAAVLGMNGGPGAAAAYLAVDAYVTEILPDFTHVPFLTIAKNTQTEIGLANPGAANYAFELIASDGSVSEWFITPRNSSVIDKILNSGAAQRSLYSVRDDAHIRSLDATNQWVRFNRWPDWGTPQGKSVTILNGAHGAISLLNLVQDFSAASKVMDAIARNSSALDALGTCSNFLLNAMRDASYMSWWDVSLDSTSFVDFRKYAFDVAITPYMFVAKEFASPKGIECIGKAAQKVGLDWSKVFGEQMVKSAADAVGTYVFVKIALDAANDTVPTLLSLLWAGSSQQDYYLTWGLDAANNPILIDVSTTPPPAAPPAPPQAMFTVKQNPGEGLSVHFDASGSRFDPRATPSFAWDFGDGATGSGELASHSYGAPGARQVRLSVDDGLGQTAERTATVQVSNGMAPIIQSMSCRLDPNVARRVLIDAQVSDADGDLAELQWWRAPLVFEIAPVETTAPDVAQVALDYPDDGSTVFSPTLRARDAAGNEAVRTCTVAAAGGGRETVVFSNAACGTSVPSYIFEQTYGDQLGALHVTANSDWRFDVLRAWLWADDMPGVQAWVRIYKVTNALQPLPEANLVAESLPAPMGDTTAEVSFLFSSYVTMIADSQYVFTFTVDGHTWNYPDALRGYGHYMSNGCDFWQHFIEYDDHAGAVPNDLYTATNQLAVTFVDSGVLSVGPLNDTGITWGGEYPSGNNATCTSATTDITAQDCSHGRDVTHNDDSDGHAGFSFTKLDANGNPLPASASAWDCVRDNVTGLIWEMKTNDGGLRDANWTYTSYDSVYNDGPDSPTYPPANVGPDGVWAGPVDTGVGSYSDNCANPSKICTTERYVADVNAAGLCGASDWRMPSVKELEGIVDYGRYNPAIDTAWFPNTRSNWFWSSSPSAYGSSYAWRVNFDGGYADYGGGRDYDYAVRLVRGGE